MRILLVVILAACSSDAPAHRTPVARAANTLRIASYNMNFGLAGQPAGVDAIARTEADIVLLQETNARWADAITRATQFPEHRFGDPPSDRMAAGGLGVLSRYPIVSIDKLLPTDGGFFFAWRIVIDAPTGRTQLLDVHLRPPLGDDGSWITGYFSTRAVRVGELARHLADLDPTLPTIIAGDFNETGDGDAIAQLRARGYTDAIAQFHDTEHTWRWPIAGGELRFQLDHIFYDAHFAASASDIIDAGNSDHLPIRADFTRKD